MPRLATAAAGLAADIARTGCPAVTADARAEARDSATLRDSRQGACEEIGCLSQITARTPKIRRREIQQPADNNSSFPRKRESSLPFPREKHQRVLRAPPLDSRFRACEEIGRLSQITAGTPKSRRREIQQPADNNSSFPRKRESSLPFPQEKHRRVLRAPPLDSRFRGNDEELVVSPDFFTRSFAGMTKSSGGFRFLHTLLRGNDEVL